MLKAGAELKYMAVAKHIKEWIISGNFQEDSVLPGQREIAQRLNVSRESVKRAMEVLEEAGTVKCLPSVGCVVKQTPGAKINVGYLVSNLSDPFHAGIIRELDQVLANRKAGLLVSQGGDARHLLEMGASRLIKQYYPGCEHLDDPVGTIYIGDGPSGRYSIVSDDRQGILLLYEHLKSLGHRRIGYFGFAVLKNEDARYATLVEAMANDGITVAKDEIFFPRGEESATQNLLKKIRDRTISITALVCFDDECAITVMRQAQRVGLQIPDDLSITGFDDVSIASLLPVRLTTVSFSAREIAQAVLDILFGHRVGKPRKILIDVELKVRDSTGPVLAQKAGQSSGRKR